MDKKAKVFPMYTVQFVHSKLKYASRFVVAAHCIITLHTALSHSTLHHHTPHCINNAVWSVMCDVHYHIPHCIITLHTARGLFGGGEQQPAVDETAVTWLFRRLPTIAPWLLLQSSHRNAIHCNIHCNPPLPPWSWLKTQLEFCNSVISDEGGLCLCQLDTAR